MFNSSVKRGRPVSVVRDFVQTINNERVKCNYCLKKLVNATNRIKSHLISCIQCPQNIKSFIAKENSKNVLKDHSI